MIVRLLAQDLNGVVVFILASSTVIDRSEMNGILDTFRQAAEWEGDIMTKVSTLMKENLIKTDMSLGRTSIKQKLIKQEASEIKNIFSMPRRSTLEDDDNGTLDEMDVSPNEEMLLVLSEKGYVKRMKPDTFNLQGRRTIGKSVGKLSVNDTMSDFLFMSSSLKDLCLEFKLLHPVLIKCYVIPSFGVKAITLEEDGLVSSALIIRFGKTIDVDFP
ncbi:DNA gyrase subunit A, chloroplastic/mitochondrial [Tanacetum coccineum]